MAVYPTLGKPELSLFSGRPQSAYPGPFADQAIAQAKLLFKIATGLIEFPEPGSIAYDLAVNGILSMADTLVLEQPYQAAKASPFNSETIGSYSYSKIGGRAMARTVSNLSSDGKTGDMWFDLAVEQLGVVINGVNMPGYGGVEIFEVGADLVTGANPNNMRLLGPNDLRLMRYFGLDPAPANRGFAVYSPAAQTDDLPWVEDPPGSGLFVPPWETD